MELEKTYAQVRRNMEERNGNHYPAKVLAELDSRANYNRSKTRWMLHLRSVNEAHVVMLCEQGILPREDAAVILKTVEGLDYEGIFDDLFQEYTVYTELERVCQRQ